MDGPSAPSFITPTQETFYSPVNDQYNAVPGPQSISGIRPTPVSLIQDQPLLRAIHGERQPTIEDVAGDRGKSYTAQAVDFGNANRGPDAMTAQDVDEQKTLEHLADAHKHKSVINVGTPAYDEVKTPSQGDVRPIIHSSGNQQGGYQYMSGPKSYNGDNFGRFTW